MKSKIIVTIWGDEIECTPFYDVDLGYGGLDINHLGDYLGKMLCVEIPDEDDEDYEKLLQNFTDEVENWLVENGF